MLELPAIEPLVIDIPLPTVTISEEVLLNPTAFDELVKEPLIFKFDVKVIVALRVQVKLFQIIPDVFKVQLEIIFNVEFVSVITPDE
jgi:hypothetical protein